jgi:hypothetical protein
MAMLLGRELSRYISRNEAAERPGSNLVPGSVHRNDRNM